MNSLKGKVAIITGAGLGLGGELLGAWRKTAAIL